MMHRRKVLTLFAAAAAVPAGAMPAWAQKFPAKPIELIVPFAAGGSTDVTARMLATRMAETFGQPVIVNNRPGGGSTIGTALVAKAPADGHTILAQTIAFAINAAARKSLPYDPIKGFAPIIELSRIPLMLLVHPKLGVNTFEEFLALAKAKKGQLNYASSGYGTSPHLAAEMLNSVLGLGLVHIPYKGNAEASTALLSGEVPIHVGLVPPFIGHVRAGALKVLAVTTEKRLDTLPDTPTIAERGYPDYEISSWQGLFAPAGTPKDVVATLNAEVARILNLPEVREGIVKQGATPVAGSPEAFAEKVQNEIAKWKKVIEVSGAKME